jgi:peptide/nickel transport system substrate-binding protein
MKRLVALLLALVMVFALVACGGDKPTSTPADKPASSTPSTPSDPAKPADPAQPEKPAEDPDAWKYGGTFIAASSNATSTMDPHAGGGSLGNSRWMNHIFEGLLEKSVEGVYYPQVCTYEASPDGKVIKLTLREDRYFSNGKKITMDDLWASIYRAAGDYTTATWDKYFKDCDIKVEGNTITFTHKNYNINFMQTLNGVTFCVMPKEICEKYPVTGGEVQPNGLLRGGNIEKEINEDADVIGSGPYKLVSWSDVEVDMVRNDLYVADYFEGATGKAAPKKAYFDEIKVAVNTSEDSRTAAAIANEYHLSWIGNPAMMPAAEAAGMIKYDQGTTWTHGMFFNLDPSNADSIIQNVDVRKAIRASLDCNAVMLAVTGDQSAVALVPTPIQADTVYHNTIVADNEWNIKDEALAKEYLKKANYNGEPIVYLITAATSNNMHKAAMVAVSHMEKVGLNIELMLVDSGSHSNLRKDPKTGHDIGCWNVQKRDDNPVLHSTFVTGTQGWWDSDAKNAAIAKMKTAVTGTPESIAAYEEYCQAVVDEVPYILFGHALNFNFVSDKVVYDVQGNSEYYWNSYFADNQPK